jgi:hypothetical protein
MISPWDAAHPNSTAAKKAFTEIRGERSIRQLSIKNGGQLVNFFLFAPNLKYSVLQHLLQ